MNAYLNLFKALPLPHGGKRVTTFSTDFLDQGVLVEESIVSVYGNSFAQYIKKLIPSDAEMNKTFHKSWKKIRDASMEQLVIEQIMHYFTTYNLENLGMYNEETVYLPNEVLELQAKGGITFYILRAITSMEMKEKVDLLLSSGMALSEPDLDDLVTVIKEQGFKIDINSCANREMKVHLYEMLGITPKDPIEYLRLQVFRTTGETLLVKNKRLIDTIKKGTSINVFSEYEEKYDLAGLASIFNRFKPIFLAFKKKSVSARTVNRIRRLAKQNHKPMEEDYIASVTKHLRNNTFEAKKLEKALEKANAFRKIKLIQALRFYGNPDISGIVYSVRNGKTYTATTKPISNISDALVVTLKSLQKDLEHLKDKKIFIDADLVAPTSGKMFYGDVPFGSSFTSEKSFAFGVNWKNTKHSIDLDLSLISINGKTGWDRCYVDENFLFSGDIIDAPQGATEAFLVRPGAKDGIYLLQLNYFNARFLEENDEVPFTVFVTEENVYQSMNKNAMVNQDHLLFWAKSIIDSNNIQKTIGILKIKDGIKTFHLFEGKSGMGIFSSNDEKSKNMISYYENYLESLVNVQSILEMTGAEFVETPEEADIDLSLASLTKDNLVELLVGKAA